MPELSLFPVPLPTPDPHACNSLFFDSEHSCNRSRLLMFQTHVTPHPLPQGREEGGPSRSTTARDLLSDPPGRGGGGWQPSWGSALGGGGPNFPGHFPRYKNMICIIFSFYQFDNIYIGDGDNPPGGVGLFLTKQTTGHSPPGDAPGPPHPGMWKGPATGRNLAGESVIPSAWIAATRSANDSQRRRFRSVANTAPPPSHRNVAQSLVRLQSMPVYQVPPDFIVGIPHRLDFFLD